MSSKENCAENRNAANEPTVPEALQQYVRQLEEELRANLPFLQEIQETCIPSLMQDLHLQTGTALDPVQVSTGLGFDCAYVLCRERHALRWLDMYIIYQGWSEYQDNLRCEHPVDWQDWPNKGWLYQSTVYRQCWPSLLEEFTPPDPEAFLVGWCMGVSRFFINIRGLIRCPDGDGSDREV